MASGDYTKHVASRRHDKKGRSLGRLAGRAGKLNSPPPGEQWAWLTFNLLQSPAWRALSVNGRLLIDRVLVEHMNQGGSENGNLAVTYADLVAWGIRRNSIAPAISEAIVLGLIEFEPGRASHISGKGHPNRFRVAWLPTANGDLPSTGWCGFNSLAVAKRAAAEARRLGVDARHRFAKAPLPQTIEGCNPGATGPTVSLARPWRQ